MERDIHLTRSFRVDSSYHASDRPQAPADRLQDRRVVPPGHVASHPCSVNGQVRVMTRGTIKQTGELRRLKLFRRYIFLVNNS